MEKLRICLTCHFKIKVFTNGEWEKHITHFSYGALLYMLYITMFIYIYSSASAQNLYHMNNTDLKSIN